MAIDTVTQHSQISSSNSSASSYEASKLLIKVHLRKANAQKILGQWS
jgi:hypothetical protein